MKLISPLDLDFIVQKLKEGAVIAHRTETCYGLTADIFNKDALNRLYEVKNMPKEKPSSILINSFEEAKKFGDFSERAMELAKTYWPGPLTIVVSRTEELPDFLNPGVDSIGMRIPSDAFSLGMLFLFNGPILTTSSNVHGNKEHYNHQSVIKEFENRDKKPDYVVENGELKKELPSTVAKVVGEEIEILRQGGVIL